MTNRRLKILACILALLPVIAVALLYGSLPERVPTHWNLNGTVTYGAKSTLWALAGLSPGMAVLFWALPKIDPRKSNYARFQGYYDWFVVVLLFFLLLLDAVVLSESLRPGRISVGRLVNVAVGVLFIFLGNIMPKVKNNFFMGIRTPWTLSDPDVWNRANRLGGRLFFGFGAVIVVTGLLLSEYASFVVMMAGVVIVSALPVIMSYVWYRRRQSRE